MVDYKNGKIYRLVCNTTGDQYIGSTTRPLSQRLGGHKTTYKRFLEGKIIGQMSSFSILSNNNFEMILLEEFACENRNQLERRERYYIEITKCVNKIKPAQTKEEEIEQKKKYYQENLEEIKKRGKIYYQDNLEKVKERHNQYYHEYKEQKKQYQQENKEEISKRKKQYYKQNKEKNTAVTKCECGGHYQSQAKSIHFKTHKHKKWATPETI
jgi:hypothetical protein